MKSFTTLTLVSFGILLGAGCNRQAASKAPVPAEAAPQVMAAAFQSAPQEVQQEAVAIGQAASQRDPDAVNALRQFLQRADLTPAQRLAVGRCLPAALSGARLAAAKGDPHAAQILQQYQVSK